jgi:hypothetical protein
MTDGAMQVRLVTQKERRSRGEGAIETLDIIISDDMGTRPYEMYSGGEAFRVTSRCGWRCRRCWRAVPAARPPDAHHRRGVRDAGPARP